MGTEMAKKTKKGKNKSYSSITTDFSDEGEDNSSDKSFTSISFRSEKTRNLTLIHELRIFVGTWNVAGKSPSRGLAVDLDEWLNLKSAADIYVLGFQEVVPLTTRSVIGVLDRTEATKWNLLISKTLNKREGSIWLTPTSSPIETDEYEYMKASDSLRKSDRSWLSPTNERWRTHHGGLSGESAYKLVASKKMVGVFITIWMKREMLMKYCVSNVKVCSVACGIMGCLGNKGAVSVSLSIEGTNCCFVTAHLASGEKRGDESRRNQQVQEVYRRATFPRIGQDGLVSTPLDILGHDCVFWLGDLNYRLNLEDGLARELIRRKDFKELQKFDQLKKELEAGGVFQGWHEGSIEFAPTYKYYLSSSNRYTRNRPTRSGDKHRTPAWCDRIMWYGKGIEQLSYVCGGSNFSDHRQVSALFTMEIKILSLKPGPVESSRLLASMNHHSRNKGQKEVAEEDRRTLRALIRNEVVQESPRQV